MIKKLTQSVLDKKYIEMRAPVASVATARVDFSQVAVSKPWGHEYVLFSTPAVEVWSLFIGPNKATSMHCHPRKKTALVVLEGNALFSSLNESMELFSMDAIIIDSGVFHSTQGLSKSGVRVLEFETPPMKHDLIRLEDKYGRTNEGYEGLDKTSPITPAHTRFGSHEHRILKKLGACQLCLHIFERPNELAKINLTHAAPDLLAILGGPILAQNGEVLFSPADIIKADDLINNDLHEYRFPHQQILSISHHSS